MTMLFVAVLMAIALAGLNWVLNRLERSDSRRKAVRVLRLAVVPILVLVSFFLLVWWMENGHTILERRLK